MYIGYTSKTIQQRFEKHLFDSENGSEYAIHRAIRKYGKENFIVEQLVECKTNKAVLNFEVFFIKKNDSMNPKIGYNMVSGGQGGVPNEEIRERLVQTSKMMFINNPELSKMHSERMFKSNPMNNPANIAKMKETKRLNPIIWTEERRQAARNRTPWNKGLTKKDNSLVEA